MNNDLLEALVAKKLVTTETIVYAKVKTTGLGGTPTVVKKDIYYYPDIDASTILDIEGMVPERFAKAYDIQPDGTRKEYKKRGRKPRLVVA